MTLHTLAIVAAVGIGFQLLPGSAFKTRPVIDWGKPNVYVSFIHTAAVIWILWDLLS